MNIFLRGGGRRGEGLKTGLRELVDLLLVMLIFIIYHSMSFKIAKTQHVH